MTNKRISEMTVNELANLLFHFKFSDCSGCVNIKDNHSCRSDGLICTSGIKDLLINAGLSEDSKKENSEKWIPKRYKVANEDFVSEYDFLIQADLNELAQFFFIHQINPCSHCGYYEKECCGSYFDDKSCIQGTKLYLETTLIRKENSNG